MEKKEPQAMIYRNPAAFANNWAVLIWKGHNPFSWMEIHEDSSGMFDVIVRDYLDYYRWFSPATKPYKNREQAFAALGRLLDKEERNPDTPSFAEIQRMRNL